MRAESSVVVVDVVVVVVVVGGVVVVVVGASVAAVLVGGDIVGITTFLVVKMLSITSKQVLQSMTFFKYLFLYCHCNVQKKTQSANPIIT